MQENEELTFDSAGPPHCKHCGRAKGQHKANTMNCPKGRGTFPTYLSTMYEPRKTRKARPAEPVTADADPAAWSDARRTELGLLRQLLDDAKSLNNATGTLDRLARIQATAAALTKSDLDTGRDSFIQFIVARANDQTVET